MKKIFLILVPCLTLLTSCADNDEQPNVIFILADDLGWSDCELYGTTTLYQTPNLLRLAERGMTFTRAYTNSPLCSPTRASIMTGQTPARHGSIRPQHHMEYERLKAAMEPSAPPGQKAVAPLTVNRLDTIFPTLVKLISKAGYATGHFGKWHLGREPYSALDHGFDVDIPHYWGPGPSGGFLAPWRFAEHLEGQQPGDHIEDRMAEEAVKWLGSIPEGKPFYMNYWQFSVHAPFDAKPELIEKYRELVDSSNAQRSATYAAMVESLDDAIGSLLDAVDEAGIAENTIIVFISDNGGNMYNRIPEDWNSFPTSNLPLRGGKATIYEGGIRVPCIVVWPGVTEPGSSSDEVIQTSDFYTTLLKGLGLGLPDNHAVDGIDIMPALEGENLDRHAIFNYFPYAPGVPDWLPLSMAVHSGDWKLIRLFHEGEDGAHGYRLYNLAEDIGERNNLAGENPDKVKELDMLMEAHLKDANAVVPLPNPDFDPALYRPEIIGLTRDQW